MVDKELKFDCWAASVAWCAFSPLVIAVAFRDCGVNRELMSFLDDALSFWCDSPRQRRAVVETVWHLLKLLLFKTGWDHQHLDVSAKSVWRWRWNWFQFYWILSYLQNLMQRQVLNCVWASLLSKLEAKKSEKKSEKGKCNRVIHRHSSVAWNSSNHR